MLYKRDLIYSLTLEMTKLGLGPEGSVGELSSLAL